MRKPAPPNTDRRWIVMPAERGGNARLGRRCHGDDKLAKDLRSMDPQVMSPGLTGQRASKGAGLDREQEENPLIRGEKPLWCSPARKRGCQPAAMDKDLSFRGGQAVAAGVRTQPSLAIPAGSGRGTGTLSHSSSFTDASEVYQKERLGFLFPFSLSRSLSLSHSPPIVAPCPPPHFLLSRVVESFCQGSPPLDDMQRDAFGPTRAPLIGSRRGNLCRSARGLGYFFSKLGRCQFREAKHTLAEVLVSSHPHPFSSPSSSSCPFSLPPSSSLSSSLPRSSSASTSILHLLPSSPASPHEALNL